MKKLAPLYRTISKDYTISSQASKMIKLVSQQKGREWTVYKKKSLSWYIEQIESGAIREL